MARPAIIIGLGGTGQWVLTLIKKNLLEVHGEIPANIKLLSFDTMSTASVSTKGVDQEDDVSVGSIRLEKGKEFVSLTGKVRSFGEDIARGAHKNISSWFDARYYLGTANDSLWDLGQGAAQLRQFGRLAFFAKTQDAIIPHITEALKSIPKNNTQNEPVQLIVVASFAGGTGAGMFIDMGLVCRNLIQRQINQPISTSGFFVLPSAFNTNAHNEQVQFMKARSFAAWRELDRFMSSNVEYGMGKAVYFEGNPALDFEISTRPYDYCYLVDSFRKKHDLTTVDPDKGVYPSVADFISFLLDDIAGRTYTENIAVNAHGNEVGALVGNDARYSVFGTYKVKAPVHYLQEEFRLNATSEIFDKWLVPARNNQKELIGLHNSSNGEVIGRSGKDDAIRGFLEASSIEIPDAGDEKTQKISGTLFLNKIADLYRRRAKNNVDLIQQDADGGFSLLMDEQIDSSSYVGVMTQLPIEDQNLQEGIRRVIDASDSIFNVILLSKDFGDSTADAPLRFDIDIPEFFKDYFGTDTGGIPTGGKYNRMLDSCREFHKNRFKDMLYQYSINTLNGISSDPIKAKGGKLGFLIDSISGLIEYFDYFREYLALVRSEIDRRGTYNMILQNIEEDRLTMQQFAGAKFLGIENRKAHETQEAFLSSVDQKLTFIKDSQLMEAMSRTAKEMKEIAEQALEELKSWVVLLIGDRNEEQIGFYEFLDKNKGSIDATFSADKKIKFIQENLKLDEYKDIKLDEEIKNSIGRIQWKVSLGNQGFEYKLFISLPEEYEDDYGEMQIRDVEYEINPNVDDFIKYNQKVFLELGGLQFKSFPQEHYIVDELRNHHKYQNFSEFGKNVNDHTSLLFSEKEGKLKDVELTKAFFTSTQYTYNKNSQEYADKLKSWLEDYSEEFKGGKHELVESEDSFSSTFICSYSNVPSVAFSRWYELREAYLRHIQRQNHLENSSRLHIFPAEYHASKYEHRLPQMKKAHRVFHPAIVMLLEYDDRVSLYFRCRAYGFIKDIEGTKTTGKRIQIPNDNNNSHEPEIDFEFILPDLEQNDKELGIVDILKAFVIRGMDMHTQRKLPWAAIQRKVLEFEKIKNDNNELAEILDEAENNYVNYLEDIAKEKRAKAGYFEDHRSKDFGWGPGQEYLDLADVIQLMFEDTLKNREKPKI